MQIPVWLTFAIAILVIAFGTYRIRLAFRSDDDQPKRGLYAIGKRAHLFIGLIYIALGGSLIATGLGWRPFG